MNYSGNDGDVTVSANVVAEILGWTLTEGVATMDNSALDDDADTHLVGSSNWAGSINGFYDETDATGQDALTNGASVELHLRPRGTTVGGSDFNGTATIEGVERGITRNGVTPITFTFKGNGALAKTAVPV